MTPLLRNTLSDVPCVILAGGQSRRFGSNKAFARFRGARLIDYLIQRMAEQTSGPIAINASPDPGYDHLNHLVLSDQLPGRIGPLAGLHAAMFWAQKNGYHSVITTPVDTPILPTNFVARLIETGAPAIAKANQRRHPVHGLWPTRLLEPLADTIEGGMRAARDWATACDAIDCEFPESSGADFFFNVNTPDDLHILERTQPDSPR
ncbi:MAG: molybdenum cofactor guanylyltransferase [Pseudomonadota bacterium]